MKEHFIALDVHCEFCEMAAVSRTGRLVVRERCQTTIPALVAALDTVRRPRVLTFEEGPLAGWQGVIAGDVPLGAGLVLMSWWRNRQVVNAWGARRHQASFDATPSPRAFRLKATLLCLTVVAATVALMRPSVPNATTEFPAGTTDVVQWGYHRFEGYFWDNPTKWLEHSPLMHVGKVKTPTLLMTGELDLRTPMAQTEEYYAALKILGVPAVMLRFNGEYHGTGSKPSNYMRTQLYIMDWFRKHTKSRAATQ